MDNTNQQEYKQVYSSLLRESLMKTSEQVIVNLLRIMVKTHIENEKEEFKKLIAVKILNELFPLITLQIAIKQFGRPTSLLFINEAGQTIDLLNVKELNQDETFNQILDNAKIYANAEKQFN